MWVVIAGDFVLLNVVLFACWRLYPKMGEWPEEKLRMFILLCNVGLMISEWKFHTLIHKTVVSAGDVVKRIFQLTIMTTLVAYLLLKALDHRSAIGWMMVAMGIVFLNLIVIVRLIERHLLKCLRSMGRNTRKVTFVGSDSELMNIYHHLAMDPTTGCRIVGWYGDPEDDEIWKACQIPYLGTVEELLDQMKGPKELPTGDDMYVCLSRREKDVIQKLSLFCDKNMVRFYYVPVSVESVRLDLKREYISDIEVFTTHEIPLNSLGNRIVKRLFDIGLSIVALIVLVLLFPFAYIIIKIQSPGPLFFKQLRTGLDGRIFLCYKFRSMHVNEYADEVQATKDDPRKYPFGNFMRKSNIDELPQFLNVLKGDMSVVGPRPHMLAHTEMYSKLIDQYMVRHFVKPGITGWAQVTGFRGETKELWQMEERVKRDIWYMEHWSIWLDIRIVWMTFKRMFVFDKNAY